MRRLGLRFPPTVIVRSRRGLHFYLRPPEGCRAGEGAARAKRATSVRLELGRLPDRRPGAARAPRGHRTSTSATATIAEVAGGDVRAAGRARRARAGRGAARVRRGRADPDRRRRETIFSLALERVRDAVPRAAIVEELLAVNAAQVHAAARSVARSRSRSTGRSSGQARTRPGRSGRGCARAQRLTQPRRGDARWRVAVMVAGRRGRRRALFLPFADVTVVGPVRWVWRGKMPESAVTLARRPPEARQEPALDLARGAAVARAARGRVLRRAGEDAADRGRGSGRHDREGAV